MKDWAIVRLARRNPTFSQLTLVRLIVGLVVLFIVSHFWSFKIEPWTHAVSFYLGRGRVAVQFFSSRYDCPFVKQCVGPHSEFSGEYYLVTSFDKSRDDALVWHERFGLEIPHISWPLTGYAPHIVCPIPIPILLLGAALYFQARRRFARKDCCVICGYNLTGNVSGRCPECGTPQSDATSELASQQTGNE